MGIFIKSGGLFVFIFDFIFYKYFCWCYFRKSGGFLVNAGHCEVLDVANGKKDVSFVWQKLYSNWNAIFRTMP